MNLLLDAHTLIWAVDSPSKLGRQAVAGLEDPRERVAADAGTIWEIAIKVGLKKLNLSRLFGSGWHRRLQFGLRVPADYRRGR